MGDGVVVGDGDNWAFGEVAGGVGVGVGAGVVGVAVNVVGVLRFRGC